MGHVPQDTPGAEGSRAEFQGPQHRRTTSRSHLARANNVRTTRSRATRARANGARARFAEDLVAAWYVREGYDIIARNWRCPRGELDIVAWRDGVLVVCEVKARRNADFGDPFEAITPRKVLRLRRATAAFVAEVGSATSSITPPSGRWQEIRFDAAAVVGTRLTMREGVF
ncbi:MAG: YraN family protein [Actinomycetota bacterium]